MINAVRRFFKGEQRSREAQGRDYSAFLRVRASQVQIHCPGLELAELVFEG